MLRSPDQPTGAPAPARRPRPRGAAAVELAFTLPIFLSALAGLWEVGRVIEVQQLLANAAREAGRQAATGLYTNAQVAQTAVNYLKFGLNDTTGTLVQNATVTVVDLNSPGTDVSNATTLDAIQVTVTIPFANVRWINLPLVTTSTTVLSGQAVWVSLKDLAYPSSTPQPPTG
jgi:Flp pilus assembly protein TadG